MTSPKPPGLDADVAPTSPLSYGLYRVSLLSELLPIIFESQSGPAGETSSFNPFDPNIAFDVRTLSCLLDIDFFQVHHLVLEDRITLERYRRTLEGERNWCLVECGASPPRLAIWQTYQLHWLRAYQIHWEAKWRGLHSKDATTITSPLIIDTTTGEQLTALMRMSVAPISIDIERYRIVEINVNKSQNKLVARVYRRHSTLAGHRCACKILRVRHKPGKGRSRCGWDFFAWKRTVWTPGGSPLSCACTLEEDDQLEDEKSTAPV